MVTLEEDARALVDFGLTYNQAKIYVAITRLRSASVAGISRLAKVRREHVYRTLPKLEKMGLVERMLGTPERIEARPVEESLSVLIRRQQAEAEKRLSTLKDGAKAFLEHFKQLDPSSSPIENESHFSLVSEKDAITSKMANVISNAQREIAITASRRKLAKFMFSYADLLRKSKRKGVRIQVITEMPDEEDVLPRVIEENISPGTSLELRYATNLQTHYLVSDSRETLIGTSTDADFEEHPCLWTDNSSVLALTQKNFADAWRTSVSWTKARASGIPSKVVLMRTNRKTD